jgi:FkbM family methyltransferase
MKERSRQPLLVKHVVERRLWGSSPFFLLDVGCSGGIERRWDLFGDHLRAIGFDPLVAEIDRLNSLNPYPEVRYVAAFVTCREYDSLFPPELRGDRIRSKSDDAFSRVSAMAVSERNEVSYVQERYNKGAPVVMTDRAVELDEVIETHDRSHVDFLKIDTDGHDIAVLLGAKALLAAGSLLGLKVEVSLQGAIHPCANTLGNIDGLLRQQGFSLFDLTMFRYSRRHLPAPFLYNQPAPTLTGQTIQADAVYFRDLGALDYERMWNYEVTPERVLKLACLFDSFDLPDCAAELLVSRGGFLQPDMREHLLDLLVSGEPGSYAKHMALFEDDYTALYPTRLNPPAPAVDGKAPTKQVRHLRRRLVTLREKNASLRERLRARDERIDKLTRQDNPNRD